MSALPALLRYALDTGPLLDYLLLCYCRKPGSPAALHEVEVDAVAERALVCLKTQRDRQVFDRFVNDILETDRAIPPIEARAGPFVTVPGVYAEFWPILQRREREAKKQPGCEASALNWEHFWETAQAEYERLSITEVLFGLADLDTRDLSAYGSVDASMLKLAEMPNLTVVTADRDLFECCRQRGLSCSRVLDIVDREFSKGSNSPPGSWPDVSG